MASSDFKVVFKKTANQSIEWQSGCPIVVTGIQISRNTKTGQAFLQIKVKNISDKLVESLYGKVEVLCEKSLPYTVDIVELDVDLKPNEEKNLKPRVLSASDSNHAALKITELKSYTGLQKWDVVPVLPVSAKSLTFTPEALSERAIQLNISLDSYAAEHTIQEVEGGWVCTCNKPNVAASQQCAWCGITKEKYQRFDDEAELLRLASERAEAEAIRKAQEEAAQQEAEAKMLAIAESNPSSKKRKPVIFGIVGAVLVVSAITGFFVWKTIIQPRMLYDNAVALLDAGSYAEAIAEFESLGDYEDAASLMQQALFLKATEELEEGAYEAAVEDFTLLGDYNDASKWSKYATAMLHIKKSDFDAALRLLVELGDFSDSIQQRYNIADAMIKAGAYSSAIPVFENLGDFNDSAHRAMVARIKIAEVGDVVTFGQYEWYVLKIEDGKALLLTTDNVAVRPVGYLGFNQNWLDSDLAQWLNNDFYNTFLPAEQDCIVETELLCQLQYDLDYTPATDIAFYTVSSKIFCLSISEKNALTQQDQRIGTTHWWLRDIYRIGGTKDGRYFLGFEAYFTSGVTGGSDKRSTSSKFGVRPAMWISLEP